LRVTNSSFQFFNFVACKSIKKVCFTEYEIFLLPLHLEDQASRGGGATRPPPRDGITEEFRGVWGRGGTPRRPNSRATPQGLDQRSKMEAVAPERLRRGTIQEEVSQFLQRVPAGATIRYWKAREDICRRVVIEMTTQKLYRFKDSSLSEIVVAPLIVRTVGLIRSWILNFWIPKSKKHSEIRSFMLFFYI